MVQNGTGFGTILTDTWDIRLHIDARIWCAGMWGGVQQREDADGHHSRVEEEAKGRHGRIWRATPEAAAGVQVRQLQSKHE